MDDVTSGRIDIYAEFGVDPGALAAEISRKYRQMALRYHPDKNNTAEAGAKFRFYSAINTVLQDPGLRRQYDNIRRQRAALTAPATGGDVLTDILRFQEQLQEREHEARSLARASGPESAANTEALSMKGLALRRQLQARLQLKQGYVSFRELPVPQHTTEFLVQPLLLEVTWKHRPEPDAQIDQAALWRIMERFGPVRLCKVCGHNGKYVRGQVVFSDVNGASRALAYDYRAASLWDGTSVRRLASLLRSVQRAGRGDHDDGSLDCELDALLRTVTAREDSAYSG